MTATHAATTLQDFLPTGLAAKELGVSNTRVRWLCEHGRFPGAVQPWGPEFGWLIPRQLVAARKSAKKRGKIHSGNRVNAGSA